MDEATIEDLALPHLLGRDLMKSGGEDVLSTSLEKWWARFEQRTSFQWIQRNVHSSAAAEKGGEGMA